MKAYKWSKYARDILKQLRNHHKEYDGKVVINGDLFEDTVWLIEKAYEEWGDKRTVSDIRSDIRDLGELLTSDPLSFPLELTPQEIVADIEENCKVLKELWKELDNEE